MESLKLNITQRRFLADNFKDALVNQSVNGEPYFKRLGSTVQAVMREAVIFTCLHKPIQGIYKDETYNDNGEEMTRTLVTVKIDVFQPGTNDKITLERTFNKSVLDTK